MVTRMDSDSEKMNLELSLSTAGCGFKRKRFIAHHFLLLDKGTSV